MYTRLTLVPIITIIIIIIIIFIVIIIVVVIPQLCPDETHRFLEQVEQPSIYMRSQLYSCNQTMTVLGLGKRITMD